MNAYADFTKKYTPDTTPFRDLEEKKTGKMWASVGVSHVMWNKVDDLKLKSGRSKMAIVDEALVQYFERLDKEEL